MKTSELTGAALDWAVAKCEGLSTYIEVVEGFKPTTDWAQGGPIIEREEISIARNRNAKYMALADMWVANMTYLDKKFDGIEFSEEQGPTPLIAAMRCYVASKMGDEIDVPEELACA